MVSAPRAKPLESLSCGKSDRPDVTQTLFGAGGLSGAYVVAPSDGCGNDAMRARNAGTRLGLSPCVPGLKGLSRSQSEPALRRDESRSRGLRLGHVGTLAVRSAPTSPKTPRTSRGTVRKASVVSIATRLAPSARLKLALDTAAQEADSASTPASPSSPSRVKKQVGFDGFSEFADNRSAEGERDFALKRSQSLMSSLFDLRRAADGIGSEGMTLMNSVLADLRDTEADLRVTETKLQNSHEPVSEFGGKRFATTLISQRTLSVVSRKVALLSEVAARTKSFEEAHAMREELAEELLEKDVPMPEALCGMRKYIDKVVHRNGTSDPIDADKSNFELFIATFGLPAKHDAVTNLRHLEVAAVEWWARRTLREAECGASADAIQRMIAVVVAICGEQRHPALAEAETLLATRLAEKVLHTAETLQKKDAATVGLSAVPQPASAREAADAIKAEITKARALGAPAKHSAMERAKGIEVLLRIEEKSRLAEKVLLAAEASEQEDAKAAVAVAPSVPPVGPATERAEVIERSIETAVIRDGVQEFHPSLKQARLIAKRMRDLDGDRKRLAAREKRLNKAAVAS